MKSLRLLCSLFFVNILLVSCASTKKDEDLVVPAIESYSKGVELLEKQKYELASEEFARVFFQHPGNKITPQAELMQAYSLFLNGQPDDAIDILDLFIKIHPRHEDIAYAHYLKALCSYMEISNVELDQSRTYTTKEGFESVIKLFPKTKYAVDASLKIDLVNDHIAGKHMEIARYYLKRKNPISAINRCTIVIKDYQTTSHVPEALYRLVESYSVLGLRDEAKKYASVLGYNYPKTKWYKYAYSLVTTVK